MSDLEYDLGYNSFIPAPYSPALSETNRDHLMISSRPAMPQSLAGLRDAQENRETQARNQAMGLQRLITSAEESSRVRHEDLPPT